jgi:hypothetical protein
VGPRGVQVSGRDYLPRALTLGTPDRQRLGRVAVEVVEILIGVLVRVVQQRQLLPRELDRKSDV